jgi:hypothetical protein
LEVLGDLATNGHAEAVDRRLAIQQGADGMFAEEVEQANLDLFAEHPGLLVENPDIFKRRSDHVGFGSTNFESRKDQIGRAFREYCVTRAKHADSCDEAFSFLQRN